jgi:hypothetical protein
MRSSLKKTSRTKCVSKLRYIIFASAADPKPLLAAAPNRILVPTQRLPICAEQSSRCLLREAKLSQNFPHGLEAKPGWRSTSLRLGDLTPDLEMSNQRRPVGPFNVFILPRWRLCSHGRGSYLVVYPSSSPPPSKYSCFLHTCSSTVAHGGTRSPLRERPAAQISLQYLPRTKDQ